MKRPNIFSTDTTLYHPTEGERVFTIGEQDPGGAWFDTPDFAIPVPPEQTDAIKQLAATLQDVERLERAAERSSHDLANASMVREAAAAKLADAEQRAIAAETSRDEAVAGWKAETAAHAQAAEYTRTLEARLAKLDGEPDGAPSSAEKDELIEALEGLGLRPDRRKSVATLRAELEAATAPAAA